MESYSKKGPSLQVENLMSIRTSEEKIYEEGKKTGFDEKDELRGCEKEKETLRSILTTAMGPNASKLLPQASFEAYSGSFDPLKVLLHE